MAAVFSVPSFRRTGVGTALLLERPPLPGAAGAARDLLRVIAGAAGAHAAPLLPPCVFAAALLSSA